MRLAVFSGTNDPRQPFPNQPQVISIAEPAFNKDGPTVADWNGDGIADLIVPMEDGAVVVPGSPRGLDPARRTVIRLDYQPHGDTRLAVADFNGDGKPDLAGWGPSSVGATAVYVWLRP